MISLLKNKYFIIGAVILIIIILVVVYFYHQGKKNAVPKQIPLPNDIVIQTGDNSGGQLVIDGQKIRRIATQLHDDMKGLNFIGWDEKIYEELAGLSDTEFVAVYNDFNNLYFDEGNGTLKQWLMDENFSWDSWSLSELINDVILPRFARLNLQ